jgi:hypothetical protein
MKVLIKNEDSHELFSELHLYASTLTNQPKVFTSREGLYPIVLWFRLLRQHGYYSSIRVVASAFLFYFSFFFLLLLVLNKSYFVSIWKNVICTNNTFM